MRTLGEAIGRFVGAILAIFVIGFVLSFLGCNDSTEPWAPTPDSYSAPEPLGLPDAPLSIPDPPPPPPDLGQ